jgi:hypothetical protein
MRAEIVGAIEPEMLHTGAELQRAIEDATAALRRAVRDEAVAARAEMVALRREYERATVDLNTALERIGDELDASHATVRSLLARLRALEAGKPPRARAQVVGGTIDAATADELPAADVDIVELDDLASHDRL